MPDKFITATLRLQSALHIGTGKGGSPTDSPLRRAGDGRLFIPGRALAGSLRTLATRLAPRLGHDPCFALFNQKEKEDDQVKGQPCPCIVCRLLGNVHPVDPETPANPQVKAFASRLWVYDAFLVKGTARTHVRDGVGIDRRTRAAKAQVKFDHEVAPAETTFRLRFRLSPLGEDEAAAQQLLVAALAEWEAGRGQIGGNVARGMGRFKLEDVQYSEAQFEDNNALIAYLKAGDQTRLQSSRDWSAGLLAQARNGRWDAPENARSMSIAAGFIAVDFDLAFSDLFLSHDPLVGMISGFDHAPLVAFLPAPGQPDKLLPVLSGSSLRGALRSHGEKIVRTLATYYMSAGQFLENCPACQVIEKDADGPLASCDARLAAEISSRDETPEEALCLSCRLFGSQRRGSRLWLRDAHFASDAVTAKDWLVQDFLAIDRFTGGGLSGAKFDAAPLYKARFRGQLVLHDPQTWELGWLALLLRDLADGRLTVGFGAAKGYGQVKATNLTWTVGYLKEADLEPLVGAALPKAHESGIYEVAALPGDAGNGLPAVWQEVAQKWVEAFNNSIRTFQAYKKLEPLTSDTFLGTPLEDLYGRVRAQVEEAHG